MLGALFNRVVFDLLLERSSPQPVPPQMFHARGERERGRVDRRRGGILQKEATAVLLGAAGPASRRVRPWILPHCVWCTFVPLCVLWFFIISFSPFLHTYIYIFIPLFISLHIFINNILACVVRVKVCLAGSVTAWSRLELLTAAGNSDDKGTTQVDKVWV